MRNWSYAKRPKWLVSHIFVSAMIAVFIWAAVWQLSRLADREAANEEILARSEAPSMTVAEALAGGADPATLNYVRIADTGVWQDPELVRVANRSLGGRAGDWQIGTFRTDDEIVILVNRGFLGRDDAAGPAVDGSIQGWLQTSREKDGYFGAPDSGEGDRVPRLNVSLLSDRAGGAVAPLWLQMASNSDPVDFPEPVPLPPIDSGSHLSYAVQWFSFAALTVTFYALILRKKALEEFAADTNPVEGISSPGR